MAHGLVGYDGHPPVAPPASGSVGDRMAAMPLAFNASLEDSMLLAGTLCYCTRNTLEAKPCNTSRAPIKAVTLIDMMPLWVIRCGPGFSASPNLKEAVPSWKAKPCLQVGGPAVLTGGGAGRLKHTSETAPWGKAAILPLATALKLICCLALTALASGM